jgi:hypothetical protein
MKEEALNWQGTTHTKGSVYFAPFLYYEFTLLRNLFTVVTRRE